MKKNKKKIISILLIFLSVISIGIISCAHSGRTDSSGGHKDKNNVSGLGPYHYHCGGHPAHLHPNGVCPYSSSSSKSQNKTNSSSSSKSSSKKNNTKSNSSSSSSKESKQTSTVVKSNTIAVTSIKINEKIESIEVGRNKKLTATITPDNATDKKIKWESNNESIATVNSDGMITAKKSGTVYITAITSNGKTSTIKIDIKEEKKTQDENVINTTTISKNKTNANITNKTNNNQDNTNPAASILALGLIGGGGYVGYKKYKKLK